jgi:hypothetical protein
MQAQVLFGEIKITVCAINVERIEDDIARSQASRIFE